VQDKGRLPLRRLAGLRLTLEASLGRVTHFLAQAVFRFAGLLLRCLTSRGFRVQADGPTRVLRLSDVRSRAEADSEQSILDLAARLKQVRDSYL